MMISRYILLLTICSSMHFCYAQDSRKDTVFVFSKSLDKGLNSVKINFNTQGVTNTDEIPDIYFVVDTTSTNSILTIYRSRIYLKKHMVKVDFFKEMTIWDIRAFFLKNHVYMVLKKELKNEPVKCFKIGPAIFGIE